jgi:hypothetical protein
LKERIDPASVGEALANLGMQKRRGWLAYLKNLPGKKRPRG